jgi:hypothetical protein
MIDVRGYTPIDPKLPKQLSQRRQKDPFHRGIIRSQRQSVVMLIATAQDFNKRRGQTRGKPLDQITISIPLPTN